MLTEILDELKQVGTAAQQDLDATVSTLSKITGVAEDIQRVTLTRKDFSLGNVARVSPEAIAYQQALADEFFEQKIIPKKLNVGDIVWSGKMSAISSGAARPAERDHPAGRMAFGRTAFLTGTPLQIPMLP